MANPSLAIKRLNEAYLSGKIDYPRVNNDYIRDSYFSFYPHPKLKEFDRYSKPLLFKEYPMTKETILLYLNEKNLVLPSKVQQSFVLLEKYFDNKLEPRKATESKLAKKIELYEEFLQNHQIKDYATSKKIKDSKYYQSPTSIIPFRMELTPSMRAKRDKHKEEARKRASKTDDRSAKRKHSIDSFRDLKECAKPVADIEEAIAIYRRMKNLLAIEENIRIVERIKKKNSATLEMTL